MCDSKECPCCGKPMEKRETLKWSDKWYCDSCELYIYDRSEYADTWWGEKLRKRHTVDESNVTYPYIRVPKIGYRARLRCGRGR